MRFSRSKVAAAIERQNSYDGGSDAISDSALEFEDDLVFKGRLLALGTDVRHAHSLGVWKR